MKGNLHAEPLALFLPFILLLSGRVSKQADVGELVGCLVGNLVGVLVGCLVGNLVGVLVGCFVGALVGLYVGFLVGD